MDTANESNSDSPKTEGGDIKGMITHGGRYVQYNVYGNLFEVSNKYVPPIRPIGRGAYGLVCAAVDSETHEEVAIKKIGNAFDNRIDAERTLREIKLLRHMDHENYFLYQLLRGLKYVHSANVLHRDLKPSNLLLNSNCDLKIADFGLSRTTSEADFMTEYVVTRWYRVPELLLNCSDYTAAIDVWSVGCIFAEIMIREPLFPGKDYVHQLRHITELLGSPDDTSLEFLQSDNTRQYVKQLPRFPRQNFLARFPSMSPAAINLLEKMPVFDPNKRITVDKALSHPYFSTLHDIDDDPIWSKPFSFDFENQTCMEEEIKELIRRESAKFNPEQAY